MVPHPPGGSLFDRASVSRVLTQQSGNSSLSLSLSRETPVVIEPPDGVIVGASEQLEKKSCEIGSLSRGGSVRPCQEGRQKTKGKLRGGDETRCVQIFKKTRQADFLPFGGSKKK